MCWQSIGLPAKPSPTPGRVLGLPYSSAAPIARVPTPKACDVGYRTQEEVERWKAQDPIIRQRAYLTESGTASAEELDEIEAEVQELVVEAEEFARNSPWPDGTTACDHVYYEPAVSQAAPQAAVL